LTVVSVREFRLDDLEAAGRFCEAARAGDPSVEPFSQRLGVIATGSRAALELWRVAEDEQGVLHGIAFAALRDSADRPVFEFYCAVDPSLRRQGLGRALSEPALTSGAVLRARVRDDGKAGSAFLRSLGFVETGAQLMLHWNGQLVATVPLPPSVCAASFTRFWLIRWPMVSSSHIRPPPAPQQNVSVRLRSISLTVIPRATSDWRGASLMPLCRAR